MEEVPDKTKEALLQAKSFALVSEKEAAEHILLLKEALCLFFEQKNLPVMVLPEHSENFSKKWAPVLSARENAPERKTAIRIPKNQCQIKELSYEEDENSIFIVMIPKQGKLTKEALIVEERPFEVDMVFCFSKNKELLLKYRGQIALPDEERVVFIDDNKQSATGKTRDLLLFLDNNLEATRPIATLLLASLLKETNNFAQPFLQEEFLTLASSLLKAGAEKDKISAILNEEKSIAFLQLLGRALSRTQSDENLRSSWTFLTKKDFEKTKTEPDLYLLGDLAKAVRSHVPKQPLYILLWQKDNGVECLIFAEDEKKLAALAEGLFVKPENPLFITGAFPNFSEAEIELRGLLKGLN